MTTSRRGTETVPMNGLRNEDWLTDAGQKLLLETGQEVAYAVPRVTQHWWERITRRTQKVYKVLVQVTDSGLEIGRAATHQVGLRENSVIVLHRDRENAHKRGGRIAVVKAIEPIAQRSGQPAMVLRVLWITTKQPGLPAAANVPSPTPRPGTQAAETPPSYSEPFKPLTPGSPGSVDPATF